MAIAVGIAVLMFGAIIGSFLNVAVLRLGTGESIARGRSRCFSCARTLGLRELIPIASFLFQRARCRGCGARISWQYPAVELATGIIFLFLWLQVQPNIQFSIFNFQTTFHFLITAAIASLLIAISVYDIRHNIIPDRFAYPFIVVAFASSVLNFDHWNLFENWKLPAIRNLDVGLGIENLPYTLLTGLGLFLFFALLWALSSGRWMGFGDAKLAFGIGLWLGWPLGISAALFAFWGGAIAGLALLAFCRRRRNVGAPITLKSQIPFGPFLSGGAIASFLIGEAVIRWYVNVFL